MRFDGRILRQMLECVISASKERGIFVEGLEVEQKPKNLFYRLQTRKKPLLSAKVSGVFMHLGAK